MSKASDKALGELHAAVAKVLISQIEAQEDEVTFDENGVSIPTGNKVFSASPAMLAQAIKFLKDNEISCDIDNDENMGSLKDALAARKRRSRLPDPKVQELQ